MVQLNHALVIEAVQRLALPRLTIDIDGTVVRTGATVGLFPLKQGDELFIDAPEAVSDEKLQCRFEVAFGEQGVVFGEPIIETLASMVTCVENLVPPFESHLA